MLRFSRGEQFDGRRTAVAVREFAAPSRRVVGKGFARTIRSVTSEARSPVAVRWAATSVRPRTGRTRVEIPLRDAVPPRPGAGWTTAFGAVAFGTVAFGAVAFGTVAFGAVAFGTVAFGAVAFGVAGRDSRMTCGTVGLVPTGRLGTAVSAPVRTDRAMAGRDGTGLSGAVTSEAPGQRVLSVRRFVPTHPKPRAGRTRSPASRRYRTDPPSPPTMSCRRFPSLRFVPNET